MTLITSSPSAAAPTVAAAPQQASSAGIKVLLLGLLVVSGTELYFRYEERQARLVSATRRLEDESTRRATMEAAAAELRDIEKKRAVVFEDYAKDLEASETKSVYHQMYHASNAQLKLQNLTVRENALLIEILSAKR